MHALQKSEGFYTPSIAASLPEFKTILTPQEIARRTAANVAEDSEGEARLMLLRLLEVGDCV